MTVAFKQYDDESFDPADRTILEEFFRHRSFEDWITDAGRAFGLPRTHEDMPAGWKVKYTPFLAGMQVAVTGKFYRPIKGTRPAFRVNFSFRYNETSGDMSKLAKQVHALSEHDDGRRAPATKLTVYGPRTVRVSLRPGVKYDKFVVGDSAALEWLDLLAREVYETSTIRDHAWRPLFFWDHEEFIERLQTLSNRLRLEYLATYPLANAGWLTELPRHDGYGLKVPHSSQIAALEELVEELKRIHHDASPTAPPS